MVVADDFSQRFLAGEEVLAIDEAEQFISNMDTNTFWVDKKQHQHHNNWFYEFLPVVRVSRSLDIPDCSIKFTGLTNKPFDALILANENNVYVECTCAINHHESSVKQELHDKFKYEVAPEWSRSYEDPVTYGELGGKFNWGAPIEWSGTKLNRKLDKYLEGFYPRSVAELDLMSMVARSAAKKAQHYSWDDGTFKPNWLIIIFDNAGHFQRDFLIEMLAFIESRGTGFERVYLVSISPMTCIIGSQDKEVRTLMFRLSGGRRWMAIKNDPR